MVDVTYEDYQDLVRKLSLANERVRDLQERVSGRDTRIAALEAQLAERVKVKPLLIDFEDFINEPPQYEELRTVRDYRHELYRRWDPLCRAILSALEATLTAPKVTEWREITEDDQPPRDVPVLMGCWEKWPRDEWVVEFGLYGSTKGGWIHGRMTHWLPASILPIAPALTAAQEAGKTCTSAK